MANEIKTRLSLKIDTYTNWTTSNTETQVKKTNGDFILNRGEIGLCEIAAANENIQTVNPNGLIKTQVLFKVGDGVTAFKNLQWASALAADVYSWAKAKTVELDGQILKFHNGDKANPIHTINLSNFITIDELSEKTEELEQYVDDALLDYYTKNEIDTKIQNINESINNFDNSITTIQTGTANGIIVTDTNNTGNDHAYTIAFDYASSGLGDAAKATVESLNNTAQGYVNSLEEDVREGTVIAGEARKVTNALTVGTKTFDGSAAVTISASDLGLSNALHFVGTSYPSNPVVGDVVLDGAKEYVYDGSKWVELGDGDSHALKTVTITVNGGLQGGGTLASDITIGIADKGISKDKLNSSIQDSLDLADTAIQEEDLGNLAYLNKISDDYIDDNSIPTGKIQNFVSSVQGIKVTNASNADSLGGVDATNYLWTNGKNAVDGGFSIVSEDITLDATDTGTLTLKGDNITFNDKPIMVADTEVVYTFNCGSSTEVI